MKFLFLIFAVVACPSLSKDKTSNTEDEYTIEISWKFYKKVGGQLVPQDKRYNDLSKCKDDNKNVQGECQAWYVHVYRTEQ